MESKKPRILSIHHFVALRDCDGIKKGCSASPSVFWSVRQLDVDKRREHAAKGRDFKRVAVIDASRKIVASPPIAIDGWIASGFGDFIVRCWKACSPSLSLLLSVSLPIFQAAVSAIAIVQLRTTWTGGQRRRSGRAALSHIRISLLSITALHRNVTSLVGGGLWCDKGM